MEKTAKPVSRPAANLPALVGSKRVADRNRPSIRLKDIEPGAGLRVIIRRRPSLVERHLQNPL